jgi:glutathione gamma-glutamylcysteinyltransferase
VLDTNLLTPLSTSPLGRQYLLESLQQHTAAAYWQLIEHSVHQSDPAYCGITTLLVVLNSMCIDPNVRWRGGWRYFGNEDTLLQQCCLSPTRIQRIGIDMEEFAQLAKCHGLQQVQLKRPCNDSTLSSSSSSNTIANERGDNNTLQDFREDVQRLLTEPNQQQQPRDWGASSSVIVVSFARQSLGQTGEGHFSPLAAYHAATDQVLVMDVARFKYAPYWVPLSVLYQAMIPHDPRTGQSRGWFLLHPPSYSNQYRGRHITNEASRPAHLVPKVGRVNSSNHHDHQDESQQQQQPGPCPVNKMKTEYCSIRQPTR